MNDHRTPLFDPHALREQVDAAIFARGEACFRNGFVRLSSLGNERVVAQVEGAEDYRVELHGGGQEIEGTCTCPAFARSGFCKHMVATALAANGAGAGPDGNCEGERIGAFSRIRAHLSGQGADALTDMILGLAERDSALFRKLDFAAAAGDAETDDSALERRLRKAIDDATRARRFIDYWAAPAWAARVGDVLDAVEGLLSAGRATVVLKLAHRAFDRIERAIEAIDDSDGYCGVLLARAADLHLAAAGAEPPEPLRFARELFAREMADQYGFFDGAVMRYADMLGRRGCDEYRRLAEAEWEKLPSRHVEPGARRDFDHRYDRLKRIVGFFVDRDGDVDAGIVLRSKDLSSGSKYAELVAYCLVKGREDEALRYGQEGLWLIEDGRPEEQLVSLVADLLAKMGRESEALATFQRAFEKAPTLRMYRRMRALGGEAVRDWATARLEDRLGSDARPSWDSPSTLLVEILLEEGAFDTAWATASRHPVSLAVTEALARATEATHPSEAIEFYSRRVESLAGTGGNMCYREAMSLVDRIGALQSESEQAAYVAGLKARFQRKRNFIMLLG